MNQRKKRKPYKNRKEQYITAVVANSAGEIFDLEGYAAVGMAGSQLVPLKSCDIIKLPYGSELMMLPDRMPLLYNMASRKIEKLVFNPFAPHEKVFPVAAFNSPGFVITYNCAYQEKKDAGLLPLFSYGAVGWHKNGFCSAVYQVDQEKRQDLRFMKTADVISGVGGMRKKLPDNRLRAHLEKCALTYSCPAAKNFFLSRYEAPLPTSQACNASCLGCLSLQKESPISCSQDRISFTPSVREIVEISLAHFEKVDQAVVSFGQGCEGDPLLAANVIEPAIRQIRAQTSRGTINLNTNASLPDVLDQLLVAGLDSIRVSINSLSADCYHAYFRPRGYEFKDVMKSIRLAIEKKKHVALNYLNCPGFTDTPREIKALTRFLHEYPINMIQWRNLNYDPIGYLKAMEPADPHGKPTGMLNLLNLIKKTFPKIKFGYFNPPREKFGN